MAKSKSTSSKSTSAKTPAAAARSPGGAKRQPGAKPAKAAATPKATKPAKPKPAAPISKTGLGGSGTPRPAAKPKAKREKPTPLPSVSEALGGLVKRPVIEGAQQSRWPAQIIIGPRYRMDKGDIKALAASINARGGLIQPIAVDAADMLIDGERRLLAWQHLTCRFRDDPIPVVVIDIDLIVAGEYDANAQRKPFTPSEAVAIKRALEPALKEEAKASQSLQGGTAPQRRREQAEQGGLDLAPAASDEPGRAAAKVAKIVGKDRRTLEKAEAVVRAAEENPEKYGRLAEDMDRTGKVDGPFKRLKVMQQTEAIKASPPPLPGNGPYRTVVIDFPVAGDPDKDQEHLDASGRSFRGYPEMSLATCMAFASDNIRPLLADDVAVWLWATNFHLVQGWYGKIIEALGLAGCGSTMLTWNKEVPGRGSVLRDVTEHVILLKRGVVVVDGYGQNPPTTLLSAKRRENSRKPEEFYRLVERVTPAPRYASIFSRGGEGDLWDGHGDEAGKFPGAGEAAAPAAPESEDDRIGRALAAVAAGGVVEDAELRGILQKQKLIRGKVPKLTSNGASRLDNWREVVAERELAASLPDGIEGLIRDYALTLREYHAAVLTANFELIGRMERRIEALEIKANGGEMLGCATTESDAERLRTAAAAPIGEVPMWGQRGMFRIEVDGLACLVTKDEGDNLGFYACSDAPFVSSTGFKSDSFGRVELMTVDAAAKDTLAGFVSTQQSEDGSKRVPRKKPLPTPSTWYRLPASWDEADAPIEVGSSEADPLHSPDEPGAQSDGEPLAAADTTDDDPELDEAVAWHEAHPGDDDGDDETPEAIEGERPAGDDLDLPEPLRRDENNHAPFMDAADGASAVARDMQAE